jgi:hypothetical protein
VSSGRRVTVARPVYSHELTDPDFSWLLSNYHESHPNYVLVESACLPLVLFRQEKILPENAGLPFAEESDEVDPDL